MGEQATADFEGWAVLELMGHRRLAGYVRPATIGGAGVIRIDVPGVDDAPGATQFYAPSALYCLTPCTEDLARQVARASQPEPVQPWELRKERALPGRLDTDEGY